MNSGKKTKTANQKGQRPAERNRKLNKPILRLLGILLMMTGPAFLLPSCNSEAKEGPESIRNKISEYQARIHELTLKVNELERELEAMGEKPINRSQVLVNVAEMNFRPFDQYRRVSGTVEAVRTATISPETNGQLKEILVRKGEQVNRGQVLARLNTSVIENNMEEVKTSLSLATTVYERQKRLWEQEIGSEIQYLEARNNKAALETRLQTLESQLEMAVMKAPFNGIVDETFLKEGELAMPGSPVMNIVNLDEIYINADVSESYLPYVDKGENVILRFPAYPDFEQHIRVHRVGHVINPENRSFRMQLLMENPGGRFKPNMMANISIQTLSTDSALVVPSILIKYDTQGHYIFTARERNGDLVARKTYIERGADGEGLTMIQNGLAKGDKVITRGHNRVSDGTLIRIEVIEDTLADINNR